MSADGLFQVRSVTFSMSVALSDESRRCNILVAIGGIADIGRPCGRIQAVTTIGLDIAKSVFQVHGVDAAGQVIMGRIVSAQVISASPLRRRADGTSLVMTSPDQLN